MNTDIDIIRKVNNFKSSFFPLYKKNFSNCINISIVTGPGAKKQPKMKNFSPKWIKIVPNRTTKIVVAIAVMLTVTKNALKWIKIDPNDAILTMNTFQTGNYLVIMTFEQIIDQKMQIIAKCV